MSYEDPYDRKRMFEPRELVIYACGHCCSMVLMTEDREPPRACQQQVQVRREQRIADPDGVKITRPKFMAGNCGAPLNKVGSFQDEGLEIINAYDRWY